MTDFTRRHFLGSTVAGLAAASLPRGALAAASPLRMQASWINDGEFLGYFVAMTKGYYMAEGIDLKYMPGGPDVIPESTIIAGKADLTLTTPDTTIKAIAEQGAPFKIIGTEYQKNPLGVISLASKPIHTPADLEGKTLAVPPVNVISVDAMLKLNNVDKSKVKIVPYSYDPTPLLKGEVDATLDFVTDMPFTLEQHGVKAVSFLLYDYGFTIYNDTVVVTEEALKSKRKDLVAWLRASRKGWNDNFADPKAWPPKFKDSWFKGTGRTVANEIFLNQAQKPLIEAPTGIFSMTEEGIEANLKALADVGIKGTRDMFDTTLLEEI